LAEGFELSRVPTCRASIHLRRTLKALFQQSLILDFPQLAI